MANYNRECTDETTQQSDVVIKELAAALYQKSGEFPVGLTVADSHALAVEAVAFLAAQYVKKMEKS